ncbi:uncharacterized protein BO97DRAFT_469102 [Aspergillus homomorphus CBS 101889]|uniref:Aminoglycoside phosphotransferase domain-containing protein n=1 Tax=Aspergillus homomorphus (strain CBS 101889) TaxID=1450537 RepID=A0A395I2B9_ASPHC|nr:hypothetical protein BO97DRAFT_469102 [Aspergillus homomorphus CBS 101889]RAL14210.1 hypothetical protein BO97DRAFT_469102 [Aspergillus homomorphus CBS 101889]
MRKPRRLLREEITSVAKNREVNVLHRLGYPDQEAQFFSLLDSKRSWIQAIVAHLLNLSSKNACQVAEIEEWTHGSFDVCVPVTDFRPGNGDEKIRCEAGAYAWLEGTYPDIPIPRLYGFAMATGETRRSSPPGLSPFLLDFLAATLEPSHSTCFRPPVPSKYIRHQSRMEVPGCGRLEAGYVLLEYVEDTKGKMLSSTWASKRDDVKLRANLFRDISKIYLNNDGFLSLKNRPLSLGIQDLENERIAIDRPRDYTYSTVDSFVVDTLSYHDNRLISQPNAINDLSDYIYQTSSLTTMRAIFSLFFSRELRRGPFIYSLTDLHPSNIFVDDNWHITSLVDLEWACSLPIEMVQPPHWFTDMAVDCIVHHQYNEMRLEFMSALTAKEELDRSRGSGDSPAPLKLSHIMALSSPTGLFAIFDKMLQPRFTNKCSDHDAFHEIMPWYWAQDIVAASTRKLADKRAYDIQLRREFEDEDCSTNLNSR